MTTPLLGLILAVPMLGAALLAGTQPLRRRLLAEAIALAAAAGATVLCGLVLRLAIRRGELVYWFGGWRPHHGVAVGIAFAVDPLGAGLATFSGLLTIAALVFAWRHFDSVGHAFPALVLVFMAALIGFCLSGDLFDMFVFFELMTVVAIALTAYRSDQRSPLQGALNFGICNAIGGFLVLFGIALLYGRTGALNLAQIGVALRGAPHHGGALVVVAFGLIASGFFVKAAIIPFHFWLADAYTSAPTPVCILFAGVMSEMGLYGLARVYWTVFAGPLGADAGTIRPMLVVIGSVTALGGGVMCVLQHLPKRLLAFATIGSMGLFLIGFGLLDAGALAGVAVYVVADGLVKAGLFVCVGILQHRRADAGSLRVRGLGRGLRFTGLLFAVGALGMTATPGFGTFLGRSLIETAASSRPGYGWVPYVMSGAEVLIGGSVLAAWARIFLGWGPDDGDERAGESAEEGDELEVTSERTPAVLFVPALMLVAGGIATGVLPGVGRLAVSAAARFIDTVGYAGAVLGGRVAAVHPPRSAGPSIEEILVGLGLTGLTALFGLGVVAPRRLPFGPPAVRTFSRGVARRLHELHSGHPGDDVAWLVTGAAVVCGALVLALG